MIKWEYKTTYAQTNAELNILGEKGWELILISSQKHLPTSKEYSTLLFKRELHED